MNSMLTSKVLPERTHFFPPYLFYIFSVNTIVYKFDLLQIWQDSVATPTFEI